MRIIVFGATGMIGQGVLEACLRDDAVTEVLAIGRSSTGRTHPKLREIQHRDFTGFTTIQDRITGFDACFFCLGTSSVGMSEIDYRAITYDLTSAAAQVVLAVNPALTFCYISGAGTDTNSRLMWARVKGETEDALLASTANSYMFRPAVVVPLPGSTARNRTYAVLYRVLTTLNPLLRRIAPRRVSSALQVGQAMLTTARAGAPTRILEVNDINHLAAAR